MRSTVAGAVLRFSFVLSAGFALLLAGTAGPAHAQCTQTGGVDAVVVGEQDSHEDLEPAQAILTSALFGWRDHPDFFRRWF